MTPYIGSTAQTPETVGNVTSTVITDLTGGDTYTFKVAAISIGDNSAASNAVVIEPPALALVQAKAAEGPYPPNMLAFDTGVTDGNTLIVGLMDFSFSSSVDNWPSGVPTDSQGNTYTLIPGSDAHGPGGDYYVHVAFYQTTASATGANTITADFPGSGFTVIALFELTPATADDVSAMYGTDSGGANGNEPGLLTINEIGEVVLGMWAANGTNGWSPGGEWTTLIENTVGGGGSCIGYATLSSTGSFDPGITTGNTGQPYASAAVALVGL